MTEVEEEKNLGYRILYRLYDSWDIWRNLLEDDAPPVLTLEYALTLLRQEIKHDEEEGVSYEYRVFDPSGKEVKDLGDALKDHEVVEVSKKTLTDLQGIEKRLIDELAEVEGKISNFSQFGMLDFRDSIAKYELRRDDIKRFLGRET